MQVSGHGNFGSLDDDPPAAMRYTEARLAAAAQDLLLEDLEEGTVDWAKTFDASQVWGRGLQGWYACGGIQVHNRLAQSAHEAHQTF